MTQYFKTTLDNLELDLSSPAPWIMGILNITPDSFSDGGEFIEANSALNKLDLMSQGGAHIVDIGGESTGPGRSQISEEEELRRILPVVSKRASQCFVSVDTYKSKTAERCLKAGAKMINDVSALRADINMAKIIKDYDAYVVLMYSKEEDTLPHASLSEKDYTNITQSIIEFIQRRIDYALSQGIKADRIVIDPGMGRFLSHDEKYSWKVLNRLNSICEALAPFPLLLGVSRKGFLSSALLDTTQHNNTDTPQDRDPISQLVALHGCLAGAKIIRTHCPRMAKQFLAVWQKICTH